MSTFPHLYKADITPPPSPPPQTPILQGATSSQETAKKVTFNLFCQVREFGALIPSIDNQVVALASHQVPLNSSDIQAASFVINNDITDIETIEEDIGIITEGIALANLDEKIIPSSKKQGVVHTNPYDIKEIERLREDRPLNLNTLIKNRKLLQGKLAHVYASCVEEFKSVILASIVEYENRILQADPAIQPYLRGQIGTLSLIESDQFHNELSYRLDNFYTDMSESFIAVVDEVLDQYAHRIEEIEIDLFAESSSDEEDNSISVDEFPT